MRWFSKLVTLFVLFTLYITVYWSFGKSFELGKIRKYPFSKLNKTNSDLHIGVVVCGSERVEEVLVLIKSALVFSTKTYHLKFAIISEKPLFQLLTVKLEAFQTFHNFSFILKEIKFPEDQREVWKKLFKPCASQRLFLPSLLPKIDKLIYVDSDTLFLSSPSEIYEQFNKFNSSQFAGLIQEAESPNTGWYTRFARHPFPKPFGVNSGVMLMDLKKMREVMWEKTLMPIYDKYNLRIVFGDQDILNIYFHFNSDQLYILPCEFNYRPDHCMYVSLCSAPKGIQIVHGNRGYFHKADQPIFSQIYDVMQKVRTFLTILNLNLFYVFCFSINSTQIHVAT